MAAVTLAVVLSGCAGGGGRVSSSPIETSRGVRPVPLPSTTESITLRDPLAELNASTSAPQLGRSYQRLVTTGLDRFSGYWKRDRISAWDSWAARHLQAGDLVFIQSEGNLILGVIDFSKLTRDVTQSPFTHMGIVAIENGQAVVYDTVVTGPGRKTFGQTMALADVKGVAVKRLRAEFREHIPGAVAYCRGVYDAQIEFDKKLRLDNDELYCTELVELAFRSTGLPLSQPIRWDALPGFDEGSVSINAIRLANRARADEYVIVPGNAQMGIWSSPKLELVLDLTSVESAPAAN